MFPQFTSDHTWKTYFMLGLKFMTWNVLYRCQHGNNPFNCVETYQQFLKRKIRQFQYLSNVITRCNVDCILLQEVDFMNNHKLYPYFKGLFSEKYNIVSKGEFVFLYKRDVFDYISCNDVFLQKNAYRGLEVIFNVKPLDKIIHVCNLHLKYDVRPDNNISDYYYSKPADRIAIALGDMNRTTKGSRSYKLFINDPQKCTNVEQYEGELSIYEKGSRTIKAYDSLLVFPSKSDITIIETECTYFATDLTNTINVYETNSQVMTVIYGKNEHNNKKNNSHNRVFTRGISVH